MNHIIKIIIFLILFLGINILHTLGLKDPSDNTITLKSISIPIWILLVTFFYSFIQGKIKVKKEEVYFYLFIILYLTICFIAGRSANLYILINCFIAPITLSILLKNSNIDRKVLYNLILLYFMAECGLAVVERLLHENLLITSANNTYTDNHISSISGGFRSASIHGHPLQGSLMVTIIMAFIYISKISISKKITLLLLGCMALLSFNTRSSIAFWGVMLCLLALHIILSEKYTDSNKIIVGIFILLGSSLTIYLLNQGWGGRLTELSLFDDDSAQARLDLFYMFRYIDTHQLLFGLDANNIAIIMDKSDVFIIENYWIGFIFNFGLITTIILVIFTYRIIKPSFNGVSKINVIISMGSFLLISSTNNSMLSGVPAMLLVVTSIYAFPIRLNSSSFK